MKLRLEQLVKSAKALKELAEEKMSGKLLYGITKNLSLVSKELELYDKAISALVDEYKVEKDGELIIPLQSMKDFDLRVRELQAEEVELDIRLVKLPETFSITPTNAFLLEWMLEMDDTWSQ